jgi:hypothetical protein
MGTIMRSLVLLITIVAMNFNVAFLRVTAIETPWNRDTMLTYLRLKQYEGLRWVFIAYLLLPVLFITIEVCDYFLQVSNPAVCLSSLITAALRCGNRCPCSRGSTTG